MSESKITLSVVKSMIDKLEPKDKDALYRYLWEDYVKKDVIQRFEEEFSDENDDDMTEEKVDDIADIVVEHYVYEGDYDCNLSYWTNIDNLINEALSEY